MSRLEESTGRAHSPKLWVKMRTGTFIFLRGAAGDEDGLTDNGAEPTRVKGKRHNQQERRPDPA